MADMNETAQKIEEWRERARAVLKVRRNAREATSELEELLARERPEMEPALLRLVASTLVSAAAGAEVRDSNLGEETKNLHRIGLGLEMVDRLFDYIGDKIKIPLRPSGGTPEGLGVCSPEEPSEVQK